MNTHTCIKCQSSYQDDEPENYYCADCLVEKKRIASEIDAKLKAKPTKAVKSDWQIYQEAQKVHGFPNANIFL